MSQRSTRTSQKAAADGAAAANLPQSARKVRSRGGSAAPAVAAAGVVNEGATGADAQGAAPMDMDDEVMERANEQQELAALRAQLVVQQQTMALQAAAIAALQTQQPQPLPDAAVPQLSPQASPGASPGAQARTLAAPVAAREVVDAPASSPDSRAGRAPQARLNDLEDYDGTAGAKLDEWLEDLERKASYFEMSDAAAVKFALVHLRGAANGWWKSLGEDTRRVASASLGALAAALRTRFQPVTATRMAREQLHRLSQGQRSMDAYIAEFNLLHAKVPDMSEGDARAQFMRGLRKEVAERLEEDDWEAMPLASILAKAARIGGRMAGAAGTSAASRASVNQMEVDGSSAATYSEEQVRAMLNAVGQQAPPQRSNPSAGMGAKTQTHRAYAGDRNRGSAPRFGGPARAPLSIPGVPPALAEQRRAAGVCLRCGGQHMARECPNATNAQPLN